MFIGQIDEVSEWVDWDLDWKKAYVYRPNMTI